MDNLVIRTERSYQSWPSWAVVYEWEDIFAEILECKLVNLHHGMAGSVLRRIMRRLGMLPSVFGINDHNKIWNLIWIMDAKNYKEYNLKNAVPIFLDFSIDMINEINHATQNLPCYWVTNYTVYERLIENGCKNVHYMALSISDQHINDSIADKRYEIIQLGRKNELLHSYMLLFCEKHRETEYIYQTSDRSLCYLSTLRGNLGKVTTRTEYMKLLASCKVSLVSTPGIDKSRDFGGLDFVTPRFYESAAKYCHMLGRYTENKETEMLGLNRICKNVHSFAEFETELMNMLSTPCELNIKKYSSFLAENATSERARQLNLLLKEKLAYADWHS